MTASIRSNIWKLYTGSFLREAIFFIPIMVPFFSGLGFSMEKIFILEAAYAAMLVLLEIPSGYFADLYGRKRSIIIGSLFEFLGITIFVFSGSFVGFLIGEIIIGIGASFCSGAEEAMVYETLLESGEEEHYKKIQGDIFFYARVASTVSNVAGAFLAAVFLRLPFYATLVPWGLWVLINFTLIEPKQYEKEFETWKHFKRICKESFVDNKKLRYFLIYAAIPPGFFLMSFWLYQNYMGFAGLPIFYFGIVIAAMNIFSGLGSKYAKELEEKLTPKVSLIIIPIAGILVWVIFASFKSLWLLPLMFITGTLWGFVAPIINDFIHRIVSSDRRATVLSIRSFLTRGIFLLLAPFLGWVADIYTIQSAFLVAAIILFVLAAISLATLRAVKIL